jgi:hypothetical protein
MAAHGSSVEIDGLVEFWTLLGDEEELLAGKRGVTRLGFALLLRFACQHGRFPGSGWTAGRGSRLRRGPVRRGGVGAGELERPQPSQQRDVAGLGGGGLSCSLRL